MQISQSISARLVIGTGLVLGVFFLLVALSVSWSVHQRAQTARFDRLQGLIYGILGATETSAEEQLVVNAMALPDPRLTQPTSGLYAELIDAQGQRLWQSASAASWLPAHESRPIGDWLFELLQPAEGRAVHRLQFSTAWAFDDGREIPFTVQVVDDADSLDRQLRQFDRNLWSSLFVSAIALIVAQVFVLRRSLKPLHDLTGEIGAIEQGRQQTLGEQVPIELRALTTALNALLRAERARHRQYRDLLADLAHSLGTPLSVLRNLSVSHPDAATTIREQTDLMQQSMARHVERARLRGPRYLAPRLPVRPLILRMTHTLSRLHRQQAVQFDVQVDDSFSVRMDESDLLEVLGNLLENACKYGARHITISDSQQPDALIIDDDGPGFPDVDLDALMQRGVRADTRTSGSGLGLAASRELMVAYGGMLRLERSPHGGARIRLQFTQRESLDD